jgi:hypothetical protein
MVLNNEELKELNYLRDAITNNPASVHYEKMQRFACLMVKSLGGQGEIMNPE